MVSRAAACLLEPCCSLGGSHGALFYFFFLFIFLSPRASRALPWLRLAAVLLTPSPRGAEAARTRQRLLLPSAPAKAALPHGSAGFSPSPSPISGQGVEEACLLGELGILCS